MRISHKDITLFLHFLTVTFPYSELKIRRCFIWVTTYQITWFSLTKYVYFSDGDPWPWNQDPDPWKKFLCIPEPYGVAKSKDKNLIDILVIQFNSIYTNTTYMFAYIIVKISISIKKYSYTIHSIYTNTTYMYKKADVK